MDIRHLRYFLAVCETLNFTRAAAQCGITQPTLSRAIQQLENEIGGQLLRRERSLTHLTDLGKMMKPRFEEIVAGLDQASREARHFVTLTDAKLTVGILNTISPVRFAALLAEFRKHSPDAELSIVAGAAAELAAKIETGKLDAAIMAQAVPYPMNFGIDCLYREQYFVGFDAGHRFRRIRAVPLSALDGENFLDRTACEHHDRIHELLRTHGARVNVCYASEREEWVQNMAAGGMGICILPEFSATAPGLVTRPIIEPDIWRDVCLVSLTGRAHPKPVQNFLDIAAAYDWPKGRSKLPKADI